MKPEGLVAVHPVVMVERALDRNWDVVGLEYRCKIGFTQPSQSSSKLSVSLCVYFPLYCDANGDPSEP